MATERLANAPAPATTLPLPVVLDLLANDRRRLAVRYLGYRDAGADVPLLQLAREIAHEEEGVPIEEVPTDRERSAYNSLTQAHLPKLVEHGVVYVSKQDGHQIVTTNDRTRGLGQLVGHLRDITGGASR